jgi:hypothetical protein
MDTGSVRGQTASEWLNLTIEQEIKMSYIQATEDRTPPQMCD